MITKSMAALQLQVGERNYQFFCDSECILDEVADALALMRGQILQRINEAEKEIEKEIEKQKAEENPND